MGRLAGCSPWDHKESDMIEQLTLSLFPYILLDKSLLPVFHYYRECGL